jgi:predicted RND superfamily exporter protein
LSVVSNKFALKYRKQIIICYIVFFVLISPMSFRSLELAGSDFQQRLNQDKLDELSSFASIRNEIVFIVSTSNDSILTQTMYDWTAFFAFRMGATVEFHEYLESPVILDHIFKDAYILFSQYLSRLQNALLLYNITYQMVHHLTENIVNSFFDNLEDKNDSEIALNVTKDSLYNLTDSTLSEVLHGHFFTNIAYNWANYIYSIIEEVFDNQNFEEIIEIIDQKVLDSNFEVSTNELSNFIFNEYLSDNGVRSLTQYEFWNTITNHLFDLEATDKEINFLEELFAKGDLTGYQQMLHFRFLDMLNGRFIPLGFDEKILQTYLQAFSNYQNNYTEVTSLIYTINIRQNISDEGLLNLFKLMKEFITEQLQGIENLEVYILNELNYYGERNENYKQSFQRLDIITILIALGIVYYAIRNVRLTFFMVTLAWSATFLSKGVTITINQLLGGDNISAGTMAVAFAIVFGAGINYTVFFGVRYLEEREKNTHKESIIKTTNFTIHSIILSGTTVFLGLFPLISADIVLIKEIAFGVSLGILIQLFCLLNILPASFSYIDRYLKEKPKLSKKIFIKSVPLSKYKTILLGTIFVLFLSFASLYYLPGNIEGTDFIGGEGHTTSAYKILNEKYPNNFFYKLFVIMGLNDTYKDESGGVKLNQLGFLNEIADITDSYEVIEEVYSSLTPLGYKYQTTEKTENSLIDREVLKILSTQYMSKEGNLTFLVINFHDIDTITFARNADSLMKEITIITDSIDQIVDIAFEGVAKIVSDEFAVLFYETPFIIIFALFLLTLYLNYRMRSINLPIRLVTTILIGGIIALALSNLIWLLFTGKTLSLLIVSIIIIILVALGVDFDIYLYNRIVEEYSQVENLEQAINQAVEKSARGIETAGLVMAMTFTALLFSDIHIFKQFGLVIFIAILIDIYFIRTILMPSILLFDKSTEKTFRKILKKRNLLKSEI